MNKKMKKRLSWLLAFTLLGTSMGVWPDGGMQAEAEGGEPVVKMPEKTVVNTSTQFEVVDWGNDTTPTVKAGDKLADALRVKGYSESTYDVLSAILAVDAIDASSTDIDADVLSPLDGVTMEVTECSDTSVTIRIVNDTDKKIQCGDAFCLEMQDEETGEWREADTVIDNAAFNSIAYMIQKDSPYEMDIDFKWLYGKLEPGRYRLVKTITDFRGTGDYTDYIFTAEFHIGEDEK